ncbi:hypothetical protein ACFFF2_11915 [Scopulibacillus daqui]
MMKVSRSGYYKWVDQPESERHGPLFPKNCRLGCRENNDQGISDIRHVVSNYKMTYNIHKGDR